MKWMKYINTTIILPNLTKKYEQEQNILSRKLMSSQYIL